jgi:hypothetical protein
MRFNEDGSIGFGNLVYDSEGYMLHEVPVAVLVKYKPSVHERMRFNTFFPDEEEKSEDEAPIRRSGNRSKEIFDIDDDDEISSKEDSEEDRDDIQRILSGGARAVRTPRRDEEIIGRPGLVGGALSLT